MNMFLPAFLAVSLLTAEEVRKDEAECRAAVLAGEKALVGGDDQDNAEYASISSRTCDADRANGVYLFEGNVRVEYNYDAMLFTDRLFVFLNASNRLERIVAIGNVSVTNDIRYGSSEMATFIKRTGRIDLYGKPDRLAYLREGTDSVEGTHIRFWMDSDAVEVFDTRISVQQKGEGIE